MSPARFRPTAGQRVVVLTGAGLSARTGLGTFRGADGLWALAPDIEQAMQADALPEALPVLWRVWGHMARVAAEHGPTPGHYAIARMGAPVITQNVDGLHQLAGSPDVSELHGRAYQAVCTTETCSFEAPLVPGEGDRAEDHGVPSICPVCGARTRPDVVLFDEMLPAAALGRAQTLAASADVFAVIGTSGTVFPAAALAPFARENGAVTVLIDIDPPADPFVRATFDHVIAEDAHLVLPHWERHRDGSSNPFLEPFG